MKKIIKKFLLVLLLVVGVGGSIWFVYEMNKKGTAPSDTSASGKFPLSDLPKSTANVNNEGSWTFTKNDTFTQGSDWGDLSDDEPKVFHTALKHKEGTKNSWELRIGNGSQIYSIITSEGELIGAQNKNGEWIDRVLQTVLFDSKENTDNYPYFIHQAGTYARDGLSFPSFSPIIYEDFDKDNGLYSVTVWPQQAHIPTIHTSKVIIEEQIRDMGDGVIEITYIHHNFGNDTPNYIDTPWVGLKRTNNPVYILSKQNGGYDVLDSDVGWSKNVYKNYETGGWFAFTENNGSDARGIGFILGRGKYDDESFIKSDTFTRFGSAGSEDLSVLESGTKVELSPGTSFFYRYYVVINTLGEIQKYGNQLTNKVEYGTIAFQEGTVKKIPICKKNTDDGAKYVRNCSGLTPVFYTYDRPVKDSKPIFVLKNKNNGNIIYSNNPYEISQKPYDGNTGYLEYLGWAIPYSDIDQDCYEYKKISDIIGVSYKGSENLMVRITDSDNCDKNKCTDGTEDGNCSSTKPKYCDDGSLINKCNQCGCQTGKTCQDNGTCKSETDEKCSDNTLIGECSVTKPLICDSSKELIDDCGQCGCPDNKECQTSGKCTDNVITKIECGLLDTDGDNKLNLVDLGAFVLIYGKECTDGSINEGCGGKDTNGDGKVNLIDLGKFVQKYSETTCL